MKRLNNACKGGLLFASLSCLPAAAITAQQKTPAGADASITLGKGVIALTTPGADGMTVPEFAKLASKVSGKIITYGPEISGDSDRRVKIIGTMKVKESKFFSALQTLLLQTGIRCERRGKGDSEVIELKLADSGKKTPQARSPAYVAASALESSTMTATAEVLTAIEIKHGPIKDLIATLRTLTSASGVSLATVGKSKQLLVQGEFSKVKNVANLVARLDRRSTDLTAKPASETGGLSVEMDDDVVTLKATGDDGIKLLDFVRLTSEVTGKSFSYDSGLSSTSQKIQLVGTVRVPKKEFFSFAQTLLHSHDFAYLTRGTDTAELIEIVSLAGSRRREVSGRARFVDSANVKDYANQPAVVILTSVKLEHVKGNTAVTTLRPFFGNTGGAVPLQFGSVGNETHLLIQGWGPQVHSAVQLLKSIEIAEASNASPPTTAGATKTAIEMKIEGDMLTLGFDPNVPQTMAEFLELAHHVTGETYVIAPSAAQRLAMNLLIVGNKRLPRTEFADFFANILKIHGLSARQHGAGPTRFIEISS